MMVSAGLLDCHWARWLGSAKAEAWGSCWGRDSVMVSVGLLDCHWAHWLGSVKAEAWGSCLGRDSVMMSAGRIRLLPGDFGGPPGWVRQ